MALQDDLPQQQKPPVQVKAKEKSDTIRTYITIVAVLIAAALLIYHFYYSKDFKIQIEGNHIIFILALIAVIVYIVMKRQKKTKFPTSLVLARQGSEYWLEHKGQLLDWSVSEVEPLTNSVATVYYPNDSITLTYDHEIGFTGQSFKDGDELIKLREDRKVTNAFITQKSKEDKFREQLDRRGLILD